MGSADLLDREALLVNLGYHEAETPLLQRGDLDHRRRYHLDEVVEGIGCVAVIGCRAFADPEADTEAIFIRSAAAFSRSPSAH